MHFKNLIPVTKPFFPPREEYNNLLNGIWEREWMTNNGPLVLELEDKLSTFLNLNHINFVNNGTIALQLAIKALSIKGEVITTPFSFIATTSSLVWEGCVPVFADIDPSNFNIDPATIEKLITPKTSAILATHCFGNACDINAIQKIANQYGLKVIYDAAHCFGTLFEGKSIFEYGDISTTSFHATKLFHTIEGGAVFSRSEEIHQVIKRMRNFGHDGPEKFNGIGINGKNSEFHAAMGLCVLNHMNEIFAKRKYQSKLYDQLFSSCENLNFQKIEKGCDSNNAYYPVLFRNEKIALKVKISLENENVSARRYFYPSLSSLDYVSGFSTHVSDDISKRILCLPVYHSLEDSSIHFISEIVKRNLG